MKLVLELYKNNLHFIHLEEDFIMMILASGMMQKEKASLLSKMEKNTIMEFQDKDYKPVDDPLFIVKEESTITLRDMPDSLARGKAFFYKGEKPDKETSHQNKLMVKSDNFLRCTIDINRTMAHFKNNNDKDYKVMLTDIKNITYEIRN